MEKRRVAWWDIQLWTDCPSCEEMVNLTDADDFWADARFDVCEHSTRNTRGVCVECPECGCKFEVDFVY